MNRTLSFTNNKIPTNKIVTEAEKTQKMSEQNSALCAPKKKEAPNVLRLFVDSSTVHK